MATIETGAPIPATTGPTAQVVDTASFAAVATTSSTAVTAGSVQTITVASGSGLFSPMWLTIGAGANLETVLATVSGTSVTAFFANAHSGTYNVVANINRQIMSIGSPSVQAQIAEVDYNNALLTSNSAISRVAVGAAAGTTVIKASKGCLGRVLVTGGTITAALTFYDNASATSGTIVGLVPSTAAVTGVPFVFDFPCSNGITGDFLLGSPAVSISFW